MNETFSYYPHAAFDGNRAMNTLRFYIDVDFQGAPAAGPLRLSEIPNDADWEELITRVRATDDIDVRLRYPENIATLLCVPASYVYPNLTIALNNGSGNTVEAIGFQLSSRFVVAVLSVPVSLRPADWIRIQFDIEAARTRYSSDFDSRLCTSSI